MTLKADKLNRLPLIKLKALGFGFGHFFLTQLKSFNRFESFIKNFATNILT